MKAVFGIAVLLLAVSAQAEDASAVLECAARNGPDRTVSLAASFNTTDSEGLSREINARLLANRSDKELALNLRVNTPAAMAGTVVLIKEREGEDLMRVYLPGINKAKKISGEMASEDILGTDFSYMDIKQIFGAFESGRAEYVAATEVSGRAANQLTVLPEDGVLSDYASLNIYVDAENCVPLRVDFIDEDGESLKRLEAATDSIAVVKGSSGKHLAMHYTLHNLLSESRTELVLQHVEFDERVAREAFNPSRFQDAK